MLSKSLSSIVVNQDQSPESGDFTVVDSTWRYQEFFFPTDYRRGTDPDEQRYPALTGLQIALEVSDEDAVDLEFVIERNIFGLGWVSEATGAVLSASEAGNVVWVDFYLDEPLEVSQDDADDRWRFGFRGTADKAWASVPNPLVNASATDGTNPLTIGGDEFSYLFRILGFSADDGVDFLGNNYRSVVIKQNAGNVTTGEGSDDDTFWLSKPNPSKFAVENLYFDMRPDSTETHAVIDSVLVDPITPGVYFHVYYTDEGEPGTSPETWDNKLWKRVPQSFRALKRERHVLPEPISTKYVKIEFSHLQAHVYSPGDFAQPVTYKKHPKWVLDYFLLRNATDNPTVASRVGVVWDTLDLAYNYYLDDLRQEPDQPVRLSHDQVDTVTNFLRRRDDLSDQIDPDTLDRINLTLKPYVDNPTTRAKYDYLLGAVVSQQAVQMTDYPSETAVGFARRAPDVSALRHERIIFEQSYPVMFFYLTARHQYRELQAEFTHDRAYFVGVRQIAFTRERYTEAHDTPLYIEALNDQANLEYNDFEIEDDQWVVYS